MLASVVDIDLDAEAAGCRALWCAVIELAIADAAATRFDAYRAMKSFEAARKSLNGAEPDNEPLQDDATVLAGRYHPPKVAGPPPPH
ncbi:MAG: hypothetical protein ACAH95_11440 [Fimbriimonas sp.]|jgi:hypothetical protein